MQVLQLLQEEHSGSACLHQRIVGAGPKMLTLIILRFLSSIINRLYSRKSIDHRMRDTRLMSDFSLYLPMDYRWYLKARSSPVKENIMQLETYSKEGNEVCPHLINLSCLPWDHYFCPIDIAYLHAKLPKYYSMLRNCLEKVVELIGLGFSSLPKKLSQIM